MNTTTSNKTVAPDLPPFQQTDMALREEMGQATSQMILLALGVLAAGGLVWFLASLSFDLALGVVSAAAALTVLTSRPSGTSRPAGKARHVNEVHEHLPADMMPVADSTEPREGEPRATPDMADRETGAAEPLLSKDRLIANLSHDMRTPLHGILGMSDMLSATSLTAEQASYIQSIKTSGQDVLTLIDDVLDLSKLEAGHLAMVPTPTDIQALLEDLTELVAPNAQQKGLDILCTTAPELAGTSLVDAARLRQILLNLVGNAIKFTKSGSVHLHCEVITESREQTASAHVAAPYLGMQLLAFHVSDTGPGLSRDDQDRIFEAYEQTADAAKVAGKGAGLGLAIAHHLVTLMGGNLSVQSEPEQGAVFTATLPLPVLCWQNAAHAHARDLSGQRIGVLAPYSATAHAFCDQLSALGATVTRLNADDLTTSPACDLIFYEPPGTNGPDRIEAAIQNRKHGALSHIAQPVILMMMPLERAMLERALNAGFAAYLLKPYRVSSLFKTIQIAQTQASGSRQMPGALLHPQLQFPPIVLEGNRPANILVAEDNMVNAKVTNHMLSAFGCTVTHVETGLEALHVLEDGQSFDLILMDMRMPDMDGLVATRHIRLLETRTETAHTPILALTANQAPDDHALCLSAGMDACLGKPIDIEDLYRVVTDYIAPDHMPDQHMDAPQAGPMPMDEQKVYHCA